MRLYADVMLWLDGVIYSSSTIEVHVPSRNHTRLDPMELGRALRGVPLEHIATTRFDLEIRFRFSEHP